MKSGRPRVGQVEMADAYSAGEQLPPIIIGTLTGSTSVQVLDGMHRLNAAALAGMSSIEAFELVR